MDIFIQIIGFIGVAMAIISFQSNKHRVIMIFKTASGLAFAVQFIFLGAYTGVVMNVIGSIRNIVFARLVSKNKSTTPAIILFSVIVVASGVLTWEGAIGLLAITGKLITTVSYGMKNASAVRLLTVPSCICWVIYDAMGFSIAGIATEAFSLVSIVIAEVRLRLSARRSAEKTADNEKTLRSERMALQKCKNAEIPAGK